MKKQITLGAGLALAIFLGIAVFSGDEHPAPAQSAPTAGAQDLSPTIALLAEAPAPAPAEAAPEKTEKAVETKAPEAKVPETKAVVKPKAATQPAKTASQN